MRETHDPFQFVSASYLIHIRRERAHTLGEMAQHLRFCSEDCIFFHTFQSLESHHYTRFSSDFAQWVMAACNIADLAERLAAVDVRDFITIEDLRAALLAPIEEHLKQNPGHADRPAFEPFHFCEAIEVTVPVDATARNLDELAAGIRSMSLDTIHYHFINSRLRLKLRTNDFSNWIEHNLQLPDLAARINRIDIYAKSLDDVRQEMVKELDRWRDR